MKPGLYTVNLMPNYRSTNYQNLAFDEVIEFNIKFDKGEKENTLAGNKEQIVKITSDPIIYFYKRTTDEEYLTIKG